MYKAILFDLDGTLTESGEGIIRSVQYALESLGRPVPEAEELEVFIGPPLVDQFMEFTGMDREEAEKGVSYYRERYAREGIFENKLYPGVESMLAQLKRKKYILAVASSKPEKFVIQILDHFGISEYFDVITGSGLDGTRVHKTEVIEEALKRLGMENRREEVLMVGDRKHDILGARQSGLECLAVSYGYASMEELQNAEPIAIADSTQGVVDFFA